ncbi:IAA-alanine resistance protein 1 [Tanacetum coccineum]
MKGCLGKKIVDLIWVLVLICGFCLDLSFGHQCEHESSVVPEVSHHHHGCDHDHGHGHGHEHEHVEFGLGVKKLPEELAEEEDLRMEFMSHHHDHHHGHDGHDHGSELSGVGNVAFNLNLCDCIYGGGLLTVGPLDSCNGMLTLGELGFSNMSDSTTSDIPSRKAIKGAGAMLGDAFLHQLPHAFGGGHSHEHSASGHDHGHGHDHVHDHSPSHSHSIEDLSVGLSILFGIVVFLFVEKVVRYVEARSGDNSWGHGHHHHHHKKSEPVQNVNGDDEKSSEPSGESLETEKQSESSVLRKRKTVTNGAEEKTDSTAENGPESNTKSMVEKESVQSSSLVFGYLNLFSDGVHNFTDGMALGSAFLLYGSVGGWSRTLFLLAHELPQEIGDFGILVRSGFSVSKALFFNFLSALVALAGTALALSLGQDPGQSSLIEGFTAGGFIYIAVGVMADMNNGSSSLKNSALQLTSLVMGMSVALFISLIE